MTKRIPKTNLAKLQNAKKGDAVLFAGFVKIVEENDPMNCTMKLAEFGRKEYEDLNIENKAQEKLHADGNHLGT